MEATIQKGVWLDFRKALIVTVNGNDTTMEVMNSDVEEFNPKGGSGSSTPYGPQDSISESTYLERRKQQEKKYYRKIMQELADADSFIILGPAEARVGLEKAVEAEKGMNTKLAAVLSEESMTDNQVQALVRDYFRDN